MTVRSSGGIVCPIIHSDAFPMSVDSPIWHVESIVRNICILDGRGQMFGDLSMDEALCISRNCGHLECIDM